MACIGIRIIHIITAGKILVVSEAFANLEVVKLLVTMVMMLMIIKTEG